MENGGDCPSWRPQNRPGCAWWMENPGRIDDVEDPEGARDNLIRISFDYWDWQCNEWEGKDKTRNVVLDYVPFHNARREGMRVVGTVLTASQAVGTAAALCVKRGMMPREYGREHLDELRHRLFRDDMNIQWLKDDDPANLALRAKAFDPGLNVGVGVPEWKSRNETADYHGWKSSDKAATLEWEKPVRAGEIRIAFDTGLKTARAALPMPRELVRDYTVEVRSGGVWRTVAKVSENMLRHRIHEFPSENIDAVRVTVERTWGDPLSRILEIRVYGIIQANSQVL